MSDHDTPSSKGTNRAQKLEGDPFLLERQYPNIEHLLHIHPPLNEIAKTAVFILDTNALLTPFMVGESVLAEISRVFKQMGSSKRLFVPARVLREFVRHRDGKLREYFQTISDRIDRTTTITALANSPFETSEAQREVTEKGNAVTKAVAEYRKALLIFRNEVATWRWNDPVSKLYHDVFTGNAIVDHKKELDALSEDLRWRTTHRIPPGYGDDHKQDGGIGDIVVWHCILELGRTSGKDVIFVSNERAKGDWVVSNGDQVLFPRFELVEEFHRETQRNFSLVTYKTFLEMAGASAEIVQEVRDAEVSEEASRTMMLSAGAAGLTRIIKLKDCVKDILKDDTVPDLGKLEQLARDVVVVEEGLEFMLRIMPPSRDIAHELAYQTSHSATEIREAIADLEQQRNASEEEKLEKYHMIQEQCRKFLTQFQLIREKATIFVTKPDEAEIDPAAS